MEIARRIRNTRLENGLSLPEVAARASVEASFLSRLELGKEVPSRALLEELAAALEVPLFRLFCPEGKAPSTPRLTPRPTLEQLADAAHL